MQIMKSISTKMVFREFPEIKEQKQSHPFHGWCLRVPGMTHTPIFQGQNGRKKPLAVTGRKSNANRARASTRKPKEGYPNTA
jgi:hypothetical protein